VERKKSGKKILKEKNNCQFVFIIYFSANHHQPTALVFHFSSTFPPLFPLARKNGDVLQFFLFGLLLEFFLLQTGGWKISKLAVSFQFSFTFPLFHSYFSPTFPPPLFPRQKKKKRK